MYKNLYDSVKNHLNCRLKEPGDSDLLNRVISNLTGTKAYIKIIGSSTYPDLDGNQLFLIKKAYYNQNNIELQLDDAAITFPCSGMIASKQELGLSFFFPNSEEQGVNLILLVVTGDNLQD